MIEGEKNKNSNKLKMTWCFDVLHLKKGLSMYTKIILQPCRWTIYKVIGNQLDYHPFSTSPGMFKLISSTKRVKYLLTILKDGTFTRCDTPDKYDLMLLPTACHSSETLFQRSWIREAEAPGIYWSYCG